MTFEAALRQVLEALGVTVSADQFDQLCEHRRLLERWNRRINLTAIYDEKEIARRHYGESVFLHRELPPTASLVDVGSGAGFPGVPVAVLRPSAHVTLVESKRRKASFLREATRGWRNVSVEDRRIADWEGTADWALIRAVSPDAVLPDLEGKVSAVAILGTSRPNDGPFAGWEGCPTPWSRRRTLWQGSARPADRDVSRETLNERA